MFKFEEVIESESQFREIMGEPGPRVLAKSIYRLDAHSRAFIAKCPLLMLASASVAGEITVSPKGDPNGFVQILDNHTLLIPERLGNQRAETFKNVLSNPRVGLIFIIPGKGETLRISGHARIVRDEKLRNGFAIKGKTPDFLLAIHVGEVYFHCGKAMVRSRVWKQEQWVDTSDLASLGQIMVEAGRLSESTAEMQKIVDDDERDRLY